MAEKERPSHFEMIDAISAQRELGVPDRSNLNDTLVKSALWKDNALRAIEDSSSTSPVQRSDEVERLRRVIAKLKTKYNDLAARHREEVGAYKDQLAEFQAAYDQFQQQSDQLLNELDEDNQRLRNECKLNNPRSLL